MSDIAEEMEMLVELRGGSRSAFTYFYEKYRPFLYSNIYKWVKSHEVSQEIFHDTIVIVWNKKDEIDLDKSFKSYLYRIAQNLVWDYFKKIASDRNKIEAFKLNYATYIDHSTEQIIDYNDTKSYLNQILSKIPNKCREVYVLCKIEGMSHHEVSKLLNISMSTVNNHVVRASKIIKDHWKSDHYLFILFFSLFS